MPITKKQRMRVYNRSNGFCWYCGNNISNGVWHVDHLHPKCMDGGDHLGNLVPSCAPCNLFKSVHDLEGFRPRGPWVAKVRSLISAQTDFARVSSVNFRTAERFNQLIVTHLPVVFWFEENETDNYNAHSC